jgi:hypothetical protein
MESVSGQILLWESCYDTLLSPSGYFNSLILPRVRSLSESLQVCGTSDASSSWPSGQDVSCVLSLEDRRDVSDLLSVQHCAGVRHIHAIFHDGVFFESARAADLISSGVISSCSTPWEEVTYMIRDVHHISQPCGLVPYPWIPHSQDGGSGIDSFGDGLVLIHMRGVREGRLHIIGRVLRELGVLEKSVLLVHPERVSEFRNALLMLELEGIRIVDALTPDELSGLFRKASCFINPLFSSSRPLSHFLMEAFYEKVPALLADFGPSRLLPQGRRYRLGSGEEVELRKEIEGILGGGGDFGIEDRLFEYAVEYGDPECVAAELMRLLCF